MKLTFDPEYKPDQAECGSLTTITKMPGYTALHKILKSVVDQYFVELREADTGDPNDCVEKVRRSQIATDIYQKMVDRINLYVSVYVIAEEAGIDPISPDPASELDMDFTTDLDGMENYFDLEEGTGL